MVTQEEYLKAVKVIREYHAQLEALVRGVDEFKPKQASKVKCITTYAGGHDLYMLTLNKEYEIIHNPRTRGRSAHWHNEREFAIIDDNGKKRYYNYKNPSGVWAFLP